MNMYRIGKLDEFRNDESLMKISENRQNEMKVDFENLRKLAIEMVCFILIFKNSFFNCFNYV